MDLPVSPKIYLSETVNTDILCTAWTTAVNVDVDVGLPFNLMSVSRRSENLRVSSRPTRDEPSRLTSPSTLVRVVASAVEVPEASLRYVDGKTLKGMGTRASKSR